MLNDLSLTQTLAGLIGLYFLSAGVGLLLDRDGLAKMAEALTEQPMFGYLGAVIAFAIGGTIVAVHNDWSSYLAGFVSLIGWIALVEGVLMLAVRKWFLGLFLPMAQSASFVKAMGTGTLAAGLLLLWAGLGA
ncbi:MAG: hypothetical protein ACR2OM_10630 [Aestuariivirgaceae bacterium]